MGRSIQQLLGEVESQVQAGRVWLAKDLLRGAIRSGEIDSAVLERYGRLLDSIGERVEAGKYLFLSGSRQPETSDPIKLFVDRCARNGPKALVAQFPSAIRRRRLDDLPPQVVTELVNLGVTASLLGRPRRHRVKRRAPRWMEPILTAVGIAVFAAFVVGVLTGFREAARWVVSYLHAIL